MTDDRWPRDHVPMPRKVDLALTVRDMGDGTEIAVARLTLTDVTGEQRSFDIDEWALVQLVADGSAAALQLVHRERPKER